MLNRNRCRFYNEVISLILLCPQGKHQTPQWVYQCFSMFSIEEMWAIDLYRLECMLLLSFEYRQRDLNSYTLNEREIFLPLSVSRTFSVVVWTISSSTWDVTHIVSEPSPFYKGLAADYPIIKFLWAFTLTVSCYVVALDALRASLQFTRF